MIPLIQSTVIGKGWIDAETLINFIGIAESTPGVFAINIGTFIGYDLAGILGVISAATGILLPPFIIILCIFYIARKFSSNKYVIGVFLFLRPAVIALIFTAFLSIAYSTIFISKNDAGIDFNWFGLILMVLSFIGMRKCKKVHPVVFLFISAALGLLFYGFII